jgi:uncharacterized protein YgiM (DUF1202 family)
MTGVKEGYYMVSATTQDGRKLNSLQAQVVQRPLWMTHPTMTALLSDGTCRLGTISSDVGDMLWDDVTIEVADPTVATVDQYGNITAVGHGFTLVTATYNGKEACTMVCVDTNAHVMNQSLAILSKPSSDSNSLGKMVRGQPIKVNSEDVYTDEDGVKYYSVTARVGSKNSLVSGYASAENIYITPDYLIPVGTPTSIYRVNPGETFEVPVEVYAPELQTAERSWITSNTAVATVDENGNVTAVREGLAMISLAFDGEIALSVTVYVGTAAYETITANANVYIRASSESGSEILGLVKKGQEAKLILDTGDGWYHVLAVINGVPIEGYSYSRYYDRPQTEDPPDNSEDTTTEESDPPSEDPSEGGSESGGGDTVISYPLGEVNVEDSLNVRDTPGTKGEKIAKLGNGAQVVILEDVIHMETEAVYKDWYHIRFTYQGEEMEGYVSTEYILLVGTVEIPTDPEEPEAPRYPVDELYVTEILAGTTLSAFQADFDHNVRIFRADGTELAGTDLLYTGDEIRFYIGQTVIYTRLAVVKGDLNGDGTVNVLDYAMAKRIVMGTYEASAVAIRAAAVTDGVTVRAMDYVKIKRVVLGTYTFPY